MPVLVRSTYVLDRDGLDFGTGLPFPHSIEWPTIALHMLIKRSRACEAIAADWLAAWHAAPALEAMRQRGARAFYAHLDYTRNPHGVAAALLLEAVHRGEGSQGKSPVEPLRRMTVG